MQEVGKRAHPPHLFHTVISVLSVRLPFTWISRPNSIETTSETSKGPSTSLSSLPWSCLVRPTCSQAYLLCMAQECDLWFGNRLCKYLITKPGHHKAMKQSNKRNISTQLNISLWPLWFISLVMQMSNIILLMHTKGVLMFVSIVLMWLPYCLGCILVIGSSEVPLYHCVDAICQFWQLEWIRYSW